MAPCMRLSCVHRRFVLNCANSGWPTLLLLLLLWLLLMLCGSVANGMRCLLNTPNK